MYTKARERMSSAHIDEFRKFYIGQSENQVDSPVDDIYEGPICP